MVLRAEGPRAEVEHGSSGATPESRPRASRDRTAVPPELSVILPAETYASIKRTLQCLQAQSVADQIEVVVVATSAEEGARARLEFGSSLDIKVHEVGAIHHLSQAMAAGIWAARAPVVVIGEGHSYPDPAWAEALIRAHRGRWAAVAPTMSSANPESLIGWADFLIAFAPWVEADRREVLRAGPSHNTSYKREVLLRFGSRLEEMLETERLLHYELEKMGHGVLLEPGARTRHLNVSVPSSWFKIRFLGGRVFAAGRAEQWGLTRRLLYVAGSPLIPLVRAWRMLPSLNRVRRLGAGRRVVPALIVGLAAEAAGELIGYAVGRGSAAKPLAVELDRESHVR